jgi:hypothetical protein
MSDIELHLAALVRGRLRIAPCVVEQYLIAVHPAGRRLPTKVRVFFDFLVKTLAVSSRDICEYGLIVQK